METFERAPAEETPPTIALAALEERLALARTTSTVGTYRLALWKRVQEFEHEPIVTKPTTEYGYGEGAKLETYSPVERKALHRTLEAEEQELRALVEENTSGIAQETRGGIDTTLLEEPEEFVTPQAIPHEDLEDAE